MTTRGTPQQARVPDAPRGRAALGWIGPGVLWALAALATGELLFTPRIASLYGYALIWAMVLALALKLVVTREIGRWTVASGKGLLSGYASLPGPRRWAVWAIVVPQLLVGAAAVAGIARAAGSALGLVVPVPGGLLAGAVLVLCAGLVLRGRYAGVEKVSRVLGLLLAVGSVVAAVLVGPDLGAVAAGLVPQVPADVSVADVLPWLGFLSNGAAGLMWYSYWVRAKGLGVAGAPDREQLDPAELSDEDAGRVRQWLRVMTLDSGLAVVGVGVITVAFLVLGAELLRPRGIVPAEADVAADLTTLFSEVFGDWGYALMVAGLVSAFTTAVLTNQDGWARLYADGLRRLLDGTGLSEHRWAREQVLERGTLIGWLAVLPIGLLAVFGDPVALLTLAGSIEAVHIPVVAALTLWLNRRSLHPDLRPGALASGAMVLTVVFFSAFALAYLAQQTGVWG